MIGPTTKCEIQQLIALADAQGHNREKVGVSLARQMHPGLLALVAGIANWGFDWGTDTPPADPRKDKWAGPDPGQGKSFIDYAQGGFSICHLDSEGLQDLYARWGNPSVPIEVLKWDFNKILKSPYGNAWKQWAAPLAKDPKVQAWVVEYWLTKFWDKSLKNSGGDLDKATINVRIANSLGSGKAASMAHMSWDDQVEEYVSYKRRTRGASAAARAMRQAQHAERAVVVRNSRPVIPFLP